MMVRWWLLLAVGAWACGTHVVPVGRVAPDTGAKIFATACVPCHGADGRGDGPEAASLAHPPPDLTRLAAEHGGTFPRAYVHAVVTGEETIPVHGSREMPVWRERFGPSAGATAVAALYTQQRLDALVDYVASLQRPAASGGQ